jgi:hypothetical protein
LIFLLPVPAKVDTVYLALAILYFFAASLEAFGFFAAWKSSIKFVRSYFWAAASVALIVVAAEMTRTVVRLLSFFPSKEDRINDVDMQVHFVDKEKIKAACVASYADDVSSGILTAGTVTDYCADRWRSATYVRFSPFFHSLVEN